MIMLHFTDFPYVERANKLNFENIKHSSDCVVVQKDKIMISVVFLAIVALTCAHEMLETSGACNDCQTCGQTYCPSYPQYGSCCECVIEQVSCFICNLTIIYDWFICIFIFFSTIT